MHRLIYAFVFFILASSSVRAQYFFDYHNFTLGAGPMIFRGDVVQGITNIRPAVMAAYGFPVTEQTSVRFNAIYSSYRGADSLSSEYSIRNVSFKSPLYEAGVVVTHEPFKKRMGKFYKKTHLSPYFLYGVNFFYFSPSAKYMDEWWDLQSLGTEGQYLPEQYGNTYPKPYKKYQMAIPLGAGLSYYFTDYLSLNAELMYHFTFTDYMDDVSAMYYPNPAFLQEWNPVAGALSNPNPDLTVTEFTVRGNPKKKDTYFIPTLSLTYHMRWRRSW
ncbi:MAG: hypothetical protein K1X92_15400 [Bacteroidia bacterium]|nr:hypothetical protein [Bacteroidia bacterium]